MISTRKILNHWRLRTCHEQGTDSPSGANVASAPMRAGDGRRWLQGRHLEKNFARLCKEILHPLNFLNSSSAKNLRESAFGHLASPLLILSATY
jgi:hypothetical protein